MALLMVVASNFIVEHTFEEVKFGDFEGASDLLLRNSVNSLEEFGCFKLLMPKSYEEGTDPKYMEGIHSGLERAVKQAVTGGRGMKRSPYEDDFTCLIDLKEKKENIDKLMFQVYGYKSDDDDDDDGEEGEDIEEYEEEYEEDNYMHSF